MANHQRQTNYQPQQYQPQKPRKPWYKRVWVWVVAVIVLFIIVGVGSNSSENKENGEVITSTTIVKEQAPAPDVPTDYNNALKKAESYSKNLNMSKQGIYDQLVSDWEQFPAEAAQYAIDNLQADYNANALEKAKSYQKNLSMSTSAIYDQLTGFEQFTPEEAQYAIDNLG